jgi:hypothetical protein
MHFHPAKMLTDGGGDFGGVVRLTDPARGPIDLAGQGGAALYASQPAARDAQGHVDREIAERYRLVEFGGPPRVRVEDGDLVDDPRHEAHQSPVQGSPCFRSLRHPPGGQDRGYKEKQARPPTAHESDHFRALSRTQLILNQIEHERQNSDHRAGKKDPRPAKGRDLGCPSEHPAGGDVVLIVQAVLEDGDACTNWDGEKRQRGQRLEYRVQPQIRQPVGRRRAPAEQAEVLCHPQHRPDRLAQKEQCEPFGRPVQQDHDRAG